MEFGKLVPQIFFDILTRFVPGAVLLCSWIVFLGRDDWRRLLDSLLGGNLHDDNALPVSMLALLFLSFLLGYLLAQGPPACCRALCAKIRAEYTMYYALSAAFLAVAVTASVSGAVAWALASLLAVPLTAWRGAKIEETFQDTTRKFHSAYTGTETAADRGGQDG